MKADHINVKMQDLFHSIYLAVKEDSLKIHFLSLCLLTTNELLQYMQHC